ncbi:PmoA family protein [Hymenobacter sp. B81]|uniref:PmoA family protein n=1 Tax=Hymenobacter sp. B81 TaxID=3344878 RepID=UPI0037DC30F9
MRLPALLLTLLPLSGWAQRVELALREAEQRVVVTVDGQPFTSYYFPGPAVLKKPVLYPIITAGGQPITRGWPLAPRPHERIDHPHQVGLWFNFGDVNGLDFWNNSTDILPSHKGPFGTIVHTGITQQASGRGQATLTVTADWLDAQQRPLLRQTTTYVFRARGRQRAIDHHTTLTALAQPVTFRDNKEGLLALRVARQLEHPSPKKAVLLDAAAQPLRPAVVDSAGVSGRYRSSEGRTGEAVWGTRARWVTLSGTLPGAEAVSVSLLDHPTNLGYPSYWCARGYGLFAANPLGPAALTQGRQPAMHYTLAAGESISFRHRLLLAPGALTTPQLDQQAQRFARGRGL